MEFKQSDRGSAPQSMSEINMTPLVDVMLVLLIIFIVTAPLLTHNVKVNLPKVNASATSTKNPVLVALDPDLQVYLEGKPITRQELEETLRARVGAGEPPTVELRADGDIAYQHVVRIMALIQNAGVTQLSFITDPEKVQRQEAPVPKPQ